MVSTTKISPITVITVVLVVGVIPNGHTSLGLPVLKQTSASLANGLSGLPVMTIVFTLGFRLCDKAVSSTISRVLPELEISNNKSFSCNIPKSPCCASLGCRNTAGMPVEQKVVAIFKAICPALPMPEVTNLPLRTCTCSTIKLTASTKLSVRGIFIMASASLRNKS